MSLEQAFQSIFAGNPKAQYTWDPSRNTVYKAIKRGITEADIARHLRGKLPGLLSIPVLPNGLTHFGAIDPDRHKPEDVSIDHVGLARRVTALDLPLIVCHSKSAKSAHLFLFLKDKDGFDCGLTRELLGRYIKLLEIGGAVELFPKQKKLKKEQLGSAINLPYLGPERHALGKDGELLDLEGFIALVRERESFGKVLVRRDLVDMPSGSSPAGDTEDRPMLAATARKYHAANLKALHASNDLGHWNDTINRTAFWAGRAFAAKVLDGSEEDIKTAIRAAAKPKSGFNERQMESTLLSGWESGVLEPLKILEDRFPQRAETLEDFNKRFYVVENLGGKCRVAWETIDEATGALSLGHQSFDDFRNRFMHQSIVIGEEVEKSMDGGGIDLTGKNKETRTPILQSKGKFWLFCPERRQFDEVVYRPGETVGPELRNLWRGFSVVPKEGDIHLYLAHVLENICKGDKAKFDWLMRWFAWKIRNPAMKSYSCPVLAGSEGIGKNVCIDAFAYLWGPHAFPVTQKSHVTGHFNFHFIACSVLIANEAFAAADKGQEGTLKSLITDDSFMLEGKGINAVSAKNILSVIVISNEVWSVPAGITARRFSVFDCGDQHKHQDFDYFNRIALELGGARGKKQGYSALLWYLLNEVEMGDFQPHQIIRTEALSGQQVQSLRGADQLWFECLYRGQLPGALTGGLLQGERLLKWGQLQHRKWENVTAEQLGQVFGENSVGVYPGMDFKHALPRPLLNGKQVRAWVIPSLRECRAMWDAKRFEVTWPDVQPVQMANGLGKPVQDSDDWQIVGVGDEPRNARPD